MRLSTVDTLVLLFSVLVASCLYVVRKRRSIARAPGQGLNDMLGFWTTFELIYISAGCLQESMLAWMGLSIPDPAEIIRSNGILVPIALMYSAVVVGKSTIGASVFSIRDDTPKEAK